MDSQASESSPDRLTHRGAAAAAPFAWTQFTVITITAIGIFLGLRLLPTGTNLSHMDFRVDPKAGNVIEFCDPLNPQFIPVVAARSPVTMAIATAEAPRPGHEVLAVVTLRTGSGKAVAPEDLLVTHTRRLHLLIVDPTLSDYQHVHPEPTRAAGQWAFAFTPRQAGTYRVFADFTPAATNRGLYASVDLNVVGAVSDLTRRADPPSQTTTVQVGDTTYSAAERDGITFMLSTGRQRARAGKTIDLRFAMRRSDGGDVSLQPVMGAFAHLVAFDETRSGFAHLHPAEVDLTRQPDPKLPVLNFKLTIPRPGRYVVWAQVNISGTETFVPFDLDVLN